MQVEGDFEQVKQAVLDSARRQLEARRPEQPPLTTSDVAADLGLQLPLVARAVESLAAGDELDVKAVDDWQMAEIQGTRGD